MTNESTPIPQRTKNEIEWQRMTRLAEPFPVACRLFCGHE
jgi:hypothetical protein